MGDAVLVGVDLQEAVPGRLALLGRQDLGEAFVGGVGVDHVDQVLAQDPQLLGVELVGLLEQVQLGLVPASGPTEVGRARTASTMTSA